MLQKVLKRLVHEFFENNCDYSSYLAVFANINTVEQDENLSVVLNLDLFPDVYTCRECMIHFKVSAPSKLSLFGEHAVMYGKRGLTAGIDLRTTLIFNEFPQHLGSVIQLDFPQIHLFLSIPLRQFLDFYQTCIFNENNNVLHDQVLQFITSIRYPFRREHHKVIVRAFIYLLVYISHKERIDVNSFYVNMSAKLKLEPDLVCLASSTVCFAACFLRWSNLQKGAIDDFDSNDLDKIRSYAERCETISYEFGRVDMAACTYGSIIHYQLEQGFNVIPFFELLTVKILLIDSYETQSLRAQVQRVAELMNTHPIVTNSILNNIDFATSVAFDAFRSLTYVHNTFGMETKRLMLMMQHHILITTVDMNQRLLQLLNVSHFCLDKICSIAINHKTYAKYTDIGHGRCAYIWCLPNVRDGCIFDLSIELIKNGYDVTETTLACQGVKVEY